MSRARRLARPCSLAQLWRENRAAPCVYLALDSLGDGQVVTPTRAVLSATTGIVRLKTISAALSALETAGWIERVHVPVGSGSERATLLRIILRRKGLKVPTKARRRSAPHGARSTGADASVATPLPDAQAGDGQLPAEPMVERLLPVDPKTGLSLPVALGQARLREDAAEICRLEALAAAGGVA